MSRKDETFVILGESKEEAERSVFEAFIEIHPNFADQPIKSWDRGADWPDFLCRGLSGSRIGVELTEWVNTDQIASAKADQDMKLPFLSIIDSENVAPPRNIDSVTIEVRHKAPSTISGQQQFRSELYAYIESVDAKWATGAPHGRQACFVSNFNGYPCLSKYLAWMELCPRSTVLSGARWVRFPARGGYYTPQPMLAALLENIRKKIAKYPALISGHALDQLDLIVYYARAILYNTPYDTPEFGIRDVAEAVSLGLDGDPGCFDKIFLFVPIEKENKVFQLWPLLR